MTALEIFSGRTFYVLMFILYIFFSSSAFASPAKSVREGNALYKGGKYDEAAGKYNEAKAEAPDSAIVNYNIGAALYKQGKYMEAVEAFTKARDSGDDEIREKAEYNIANSKYKLGSLQADAEPEHAVGLYREALDGYNSAMTLDKEDKDAKYNHELVQKKLEELLKKMKDREQKKEQGQDGKEGQDKKDQQEKGDKGEGQKQKPAEDTARQGEKDKNADKQKDAAEQAGRKDRSASQGMTAEEAKMLLDAYGQEEGGKLDDRGRRVYDEGVLKDW